MARTSAKAKKSKQEVNRNKEESKQDENKSDMEGNNESTDKENDDINFEVEKISHTRIFKGKRQYLVRWKGYKEDNDTWENESVLLSCKDVLDAFKKEHPFDEKSEDEVLEDGEEEKGKSRNKKVTKKAVKTKSKQSGRSSKIKNVEELKTLSSEESESEIEEEVEDKNKKRGKKHKMPIEKNEELQTSSENENELEDKNIKINVKRKNKGKTSKGVEKFVDEIEANKNNEVKGKKRGKTPKESKSKRAKKCESDDESITDGKNYEVDKILEVHTRKDGSREFLIRWKGYRPSDDTWEPEAHLDCQELIEKFMEKVDKAKEIPAKELRTNRTMTKRFIPTTVCQGRASLRNVGFRPSYME